MVTLWILLPLAITAGGYAQIQYAKAGFPKSVWWRVVLFITGAVVVNIGVALSSWLEHMSYDLVTIVIGTIFSGFLFAWAMPKQMRWVYPPRDGGR